MQQKKFRIAAKRNRETLVKGLGWFSIGLGLAEILAPRAVSKLVGVRPRARLVQLFGLREIISGIGILTQPRPVNGMAARVAGDALDLSALGAGFLSRDS